MNLKEKIKNKIKRYENSNRDLLDMIGQCGKDDDRNAENYIKMYYNKLEKIDLLKKILLESEK